MKITLGDQKRSYLEDVFRTTADARLGIRVQAILMAHRGRRHRHITEDLDVAVRALRRWLRVYQAKRLAWLKLWWHLLHKYQAAKTLLEPPRRPVWFTARRLNGCTVAPTGVTYGMHRRESRHSCLKSRSHPRLHRHRS
jgi:hypothetical protein